MYYFELSEAVPYHIGLYWTGDTVCWDCRYLKVLLMNRDENQEEE
jgi:hypothetical protein